FVNSLEHIDSDRTFREFRWLHRLVPFSKAHRPSSIAAQLAILRNGVLCLLTFVLLFSECGRALDNHKAEKQTKILHIDLALLPNVLPRNDLPLVGIAYIGRQCA